MKAAGPTLGELVLLGGGHAQVAVLKQFAMHPLPGLRLTLVTPDVRTPYSGMLPGFVEGVWSEDDIHIDLTHLAQMAGARLVIAAATGLDAEQKTLSFANRPPIHFDMLSINIGGQPALDVIDGAQKHAIPVKPISLFQNRLETVVTAGSARRIAIIGGGAAGCELALALSKRWLDEFGERPQMMLFGRSNHLVPHMNESAAKLLAHDLETIGCQLVLGPNVVKITAKDLHLADGSQHPFDACFLSTEVAPPAWLGTSGIARDPAGFITVDQTLQSTSHPYIFASGDIASLTPDARPKSGVFAVRAGPHLAHNLRQYALGGALRNWRAQSQHLAIIGTGDGKAIGVRGGHASKSRLWWYLKCWIDRRWMRRYKNLSMDPPHAPSRLPGINGKVRDAQKEHDPAFSAMRCLGCGAKTGHETLAGALARAAELALKAGADPALIPVSGLAEDSAILPLPPPGVEIVQSVDMISEIVSDPFRLGKIAANHALSDLYAANAQPAHALAIMSLAESRIDLQQEQLTQILAGGLQALAAAGARLVGGHTSEGRDLSLGYAVTGWRSAEPKPLSPKRHYNLVLSKPLGSGVIMAGQMALRTSGRSFAAALDVMELSNAVAAEIFNDKAKGGAWMTDVTGFGLARHALNLAERTGFDGAEIYLADLPFIDGALAAVVAGIRSSLHEQNRAAVRFQESHLSNEDRFRAELLFDPQTGGGLLAVLDETAAEAALEALQAAGHQAATIGRIGPDIRGLSVHSGRA